MLSLLSRAERSFDDVDDHGHGFSVKPQRTRRGQLGKTLDTARAEDVAPAVDPRNVRLPPVHNTPDRFGYVEGHRVTLYIYMYIYINIVRSQRLLSTVLFHLLMLCVCSFVGELYGVEERELNYGVKLYEEAVMRKMQKEDRMQEVHHQSDPLTKETFT